MFSFSTIFYRNKEKISMLNEFLFICVNLGVKSTFIFKFRETDSEELLNWFFS